MANRNAFGLAASLLICLLAWCQPKPAQAQAIVMSVNGAPITTYDIAQRMKLLRLLRKPASREAAINSLIADNVKLQELSQFTIKISESDILAQGAQDAKEAKISPVTLAAALHSSGIDKNNWHQYFKAQAEWNLYVHAMNKTLDVSDAQIDAALAARGESQGLTQYLVRQIVVVVANPNDLSRRMPEANDIRAHFDNCATGVAMARRQPNVVVQALITRNSSDLDQQVRAQFDKTPIGHLTPPQASPQGIQMIAVCNRKILHDDSAVSRRFRDELLKTKLEKASEALYAPLRARAVIVRFGS